MPFKTKEDKAKYHREYHAEWYKKNKEETRQKQQERRKEIREWFADYKSKLKCTNCSEDHPVTLDFHHLEDKDQEVSRLVADGSSKKRILKEINKCIVLCANCHRKAHIVGSIPTGVTDNFSEF